ncbi:Uncharacterized protein PPKH_2892 [Pseudomonas putida]|nr:Uncharacterized protein PPKH_2892 [Pseudomonas putida]
MSPSLLQVGRGIQLIIAMDVIICPALQKTDSALHEADIASHGQPLT